MAAPGVRAREAKSGALVIRVNLFRDQRRPKCPVSWPTHMLLKQLEMEMSICQFRADPLNAAG